MPPSTVEQQYAYLFSVQALPIQPFMNSSRSLFT